MNCTHYACRCWRAAELAAMNRPLDALAAHDQEVPCRLAPDAEPPEPIDPADAGKYS